MSTCEAPANTFEFGSLEFPKSINVNDDLPAEETLSQIADYPVFDLDGKQAPFRSLYEHKNHGGKRNYKVLIIFIRHFFCCSCQDYIKYISDKLPSVAELSALPEPVAIVIIGCGAPSLIPFYAESTSCTFPIYAEPTRRLYSELRLTKSFARSEILPDYITNTWLIGAAIRSFSQIFGRIMHNDWWKGGSKGQGGGEFLFEDGKVTWCHRMRNTMDHSNIGKIKEVLGLPVDEDVVEGA